ncbi:isopeptide-forming domain-containing fimbrial protein [Microbulbifer elongatus]|uniref:isopeptide-forming domain-containing fimbrial protein n=1 Tax=Microbulbifer elongatus TaxID=86173 RepID=UPI001CFD947D|nr:isopeptide-forming domain-containing fimbrial protein [Microbulbifer elongatus]
MELNEFSRSSLAQAINQRGRRLTSLHRALEKRVLLDASVATDVSHSGNDSGLTGSAGSFDSGDDTTAALHNDKPSDKQGDTKKLFTEIQESETGARTELVVIDLQLNDAQALVDDLVRQASEITEIGDALQLTIGERSITLLALDIDDGLNTVTDFLQHSGQTFDAIHLVSHGGAGGIDVGGDALSLSSLAGEDGSDHSAQLQSWADHLNSGADILLYGCNTGYSLTGENFIEQLASLTGADVAASEDATGSALRGGDWDLEVQNGEVETDIVFSQLLQGTWEGLMVATPSATVDAPAEDFINESTDIGFSFDNDGDTTGYGPFIDVVAGPGLEIESVNGLAGANVETYTYENGQWVDSGGNPVEFHPYDFNQTGAIPLPPGTEGATWYAIQLPFGSFTPGQPSFDFSISALLDEAAGAMVGVPIPIWVRPGFAFGNDPLNNPDTDPPILSNPIETTVTPTVIDVTKVAQDGDGDNSSIGDDGETVTGPSEPVTWQVSVDIANLSTINNLVVTEVVPNNFYYLPGNVVVTDAGGNTLQEGVDYDLTEPPEGATNNAELIVEFSNPVIGIEGGGDIVITYTGYVPDFDANGNPIVINDGANDAVRNTASVTGDYNGEGISDSDDAIITATATALQKSVTAIEDNGGAGNTPGDRLQYTLTLQVSDYMELANLILTDTMQDGIEIDPDSFTFELFVNGNTVGPDALGAGNTSVVVNDPGDGTTDISIDLSQELIDRGISADGSLIGDLFADAITEGTTTITITYEATIREFYLATDDPVNVFDTISNQSSVNGTAESANGEGVENGSGAGVTIDGADSEKSVYAIEGSTDPNDLGEIAVGEAVTFAIEVDLATLDSNGIQITDYLPLPVFLASEPTFTDTAEGSLIPGVGEWGFGPATDFDNWPPDYLNDINITTSANAGDNSITWNFAPVDQEDSIGGTIQLLFTVEVQDEPFTDGLFLTNVSQTSVSGTDETVTLPPDNIQVEVVSPEINVTKGVIGTDDSSGVFDPTTTGPVTFVPAGTDPIPNTPPWIGTITSDGLDTSPIDSNLSEVDAGDTVRFAITVENTGGSDAFNLVISDTLPDGFEIPAGGINLQVFTGDGTPVAFTGNPEDLFTTGITLTDPSADEGALNEGRDPDTGPTTDGSNIIVITYDLISTDTVQPGQIIENTAQLEQYGGVDGGNDYTDGNSNINWQDDATVTLRENEVEKTLVGTSIPGDNNANDEAVIGEVITYTVTATIAEGVTPSASLVDTLDDGLVFLGITTVTSSSADIQNGDGTPWGIGDIDESTNGQQVTFDLGDLNNINRDNNVAETITITYEVLVANDVANQSGDQLNNRVEFLWDSTADGVDNPTVNDTDSAENVTVIEPDLQVDKTLSSTDPIIDAGDPIQYTINISHTGFSDTGAFDATFIDTLPPELTGVSLASAILTVDGMNTDVSDIFQTVGNTVQTIPGESFDLPLGATLTIIVDAEVVDPILAGTTVTNTGTVDWESIDGDDPNERTGEDGEGGALNDYEDSGSVEFDIASVAEGKVILNSSVQDEFNGRTEAVIGEEVTYFAAFLVPEVSVPLAQIIDTLPEGMVFVRVESIYVGDDIEILSGGYGDPTVTVNPDGTTTLDFGTANLANNANGTLDANDLIGITYTVRVINVDSNQSGTELTNNAQFFWDQDGNGDNMDDDGFVEDSTTVTVIEPQLVIDKSADVTSGDNGDAVNYTITITNPDDGSSTTAYDITFSDPLPAELSDITFSASLETTAGTSDVTGFFEIIGGELVLNPQAELDLAPGSLVTINVSGILTNTIAGSTISNTADTDWTSLDGVDENERTGDGGINDYFANDSVNITVNGPQIEKVLVSTSQNDSLNDDTEATIGEIVTFSVTVTLPEASTTGRITDIYGPGFEFLELVSVTVSDPDAIQFNPGDVTAIDDPANNTVGFDFGTLENTDTDNSTEETITFVYRLRVTDIPSNVDGTTLSNDATLEYDTDGDEIPDASVSDSASVDVVEPLLTIDKELLSDTPLTLGGIATFQLTVQLDPASGGHAYNVTIEDALPPFLSGVENVQIEVSGGTPVIIDNSTANLLLLEISEIDPSTVVTITVDARVTSDPAAVGQTTTNIADAVYTSLDTPEGGDDGDIEREYDDSDQVSALIEAVDLFIDKDDGGISAEPGDQITYTINYGNRGELDATGVVITESLPEYVTFDPADNPGWTLNGDTLTFNVGDLAAGETGSVELVVTVIEPLPAGVEETNNTVSIDGDETNGVDPTPEDNTDVDVTPLIAAPDYVIDKIENFDDPAAPGETISWDIVVTNEGNQDGTGVVVTDTLPTGDFFDAGFTASDGGVVDLDAGTVTWDIGDLAVGETVTLTLTTTVNENVPPVLLPTQVNSVEVTDDGTNGPDPTPENNSDSEPFDITLVDLAITKDDGGISTTPGGSITYTLEYANIGGFDAEDTVITETLPDNVTFDVANSDPRWVDQGDGTLTLDLGTVASGESGSVTFTVIVDNPLPAGVEEILNETEIDYGGGNGPDQNLSNNTDDDTTPIDAAPDYVIDKIENFEDPANPGDSIEWTIVVTNEGNQDGTGVVITDALPSTNLFSEFTASDGGVIDLNAGTVTWDIGDLDAGETVSVTLTAVVVEQLPVAFPPQANGVEVTDDGANGPDPTPENNTDVEEFDITFVDMSINKSVGMREIVPGQTVIYTLEYGNLGTSDASGVTITESLPEYSTFDPTNSTPGWTLVGDEYVLDIGDVPAGGSGTVTFAVTFDETIPAGVTIIPNVAVIDDDGTNGPDQELENNTSDNSRVPPEVVIVAQPDYEIDKIENFDDPANPGDAISWTIVVANNGNQDGTGVVVTDTLPDTSLFNSFVASDGGVIDLAAGTVTWDIGDLAAGDSVTLSLSAVVNESVPTNIPPQTNSVVVEDDGNNGEDPTPENNRDDETLEIQYVDLFIDKDYDGPVPEPTDTIVYTLTYGNRGTATSNGVVITETLPPNTSFDAANSTPGWVQNGDTFTFDVGTLAPGEVATINFAVVIDYPLDATVQQIDNAAVITDDGGNGPDQNIEDNTDSDEIEIRNDTNVDNITLSQLHGDYIYPPRDWERMAPELHGRLISSETTDVSANLQGARNGGNYDPAFGAVDGKHYPNDWSRVFGNDLSIEIGDDTRGEKSSPLQLDDDIGRYRANSLFGDFERPAASPELPAGAPRWAPEAEPLPSPLRSSPPADEPVNLSPERSQLQLQLDDITREMNESRVSPLLVALAELSSEEARQQQAK